MRARLAAPSAFATSVVLHAVGLATGAWLLSRSLSAPDARDVPQAHEVEVAVDAPPAVQLPAMVFFARRILIGDPTIWLRPITTQFFPLVAKAG